MAEETALALVQSVLSNAGVKSILIGGFAVMHHGYQRATQDFVLVDQNTFHNVQRSGHRICVSGKDFVVPSLESLIAMKFHAIKQDPRERTIKDLPDIARLLKVNNIDPRSSSFREMCLKFGNQDIYDKILMLMEP